MAAVPVTFEQMQQFRAEIDGRIAAAQATSAASFQTAALQNRNESAVAVEAKFSELSERVMGLFGKQKTRMDLIATKVLADAEEFEAKTTAMSDRIGAVNFENWCVSGVMLQTSRLSSTSSALNCRRSSSRALGKLPAS